MKFTVYFQPLPRSLKCLSSFSCVMEEEVRFLHSLLVNYQLFPYRLCNSFLIKLMWFYFLTLSSVPLMCTFSIFKVPRAIHVHFRLRTAWLVGRWAGSGSGTAQVSAWCFMADGQTGFFTYRCFFSLLLGMLASRRFRVPSLWQHRV